jgi:hypothetical protein
MRLIVAYLVLTHCDQIVAYLEHQDFQLSAIILMTIHAIFTTIIPTMPVQARMRTHVRTYVGKHADCHPVILEREKSGFYCNKAGEPCFTHEQ